VGGARTAILATHDLGYVAEVATEVAFLNRGRLLGRCQTAGLSPTGLRERYAEALARRPVADRRRPVGVAD
jgi:ABC-type polar amino acid transport system ATPase subunit